MEQPSKIKNSPMRKITNFEAYIEAHPDWCELLVRLRDLLMKTELQETIKWGAPVYTLNGKNLVGLGAYKQYAGLWFFNGVLLEDKESKLVNAREGKTKSMRQWRFSNASDIDDKLILAYINETIALQKAGKTIEKQPTKVMQIPQELEAAFGEDANLEKSFADFSPYKQKEFAEHISSAKRDTTRMSRLQKCIPMILAGVGLNDKYRNC